MGGSLEPKSFETSMGNMAETPVYKKYKKISWAWWHVPVIPGRGAAGALSSHDHFSEVEAAESHDHATALQPG
uniref:Macaca fascicularis brain cDNA clone: QmoA-10565, similar to human ribosomal protein L14 (RPL14), mRNA, RefSeq: NM_003973.2 n=1 Tax=Macaca fascicularis TaxID=9541 RepID=I7GN16_MACFA|nr:unnamed protein product [Macaca fascicularis]